LLSVLVLAGIELIFFLVACVVVCFGFVMKIVLITHQCFSYCWAIADTESRPLLLLTPSRQRAGWGWARYLERSQPGRL